MRLAMRTWKVGTPSIGKCTSDHRMAMERREYRAGRGLGTKPSSTAEIGNSRKNAEPIRPNCSGLSFSSATSGWAARPSTALSAKLMNMKRKIRAVMPQAPGRGRSWTVTLRMAPGLVGRQGDGVPGQHLAIDLGLDEQHADHAAGHQQHAQHDEALLVTHQGRAPRLDPAAHDQRRQNAGQADGGDGDGERRGTP